MEKKCIDVQEMLTPFIRILSDTHRMGRFSEFFKPVISVTPYLKCPAYPNYRKISYFVGLNSDDEYPILVGPLPYLP